MGRARRPLGLFVQPRDLRALRLYRLEIQFTNLRAHHKVRHGRARPSRLIPLAGRQIFLQAHPRAWPTVHIPAVVFESKARCGGAGYFADHKSIEVAVRPRKDSTAICSRCHQLGPGYDQLVKRRFEFIPFWGFLVYLLYSMRRVDCRRCQAVVVEEVSWADGKPTLTKAYMLSLASWTRRLSWKETAEAFRTSHVLKRVEDFVPRFRRLRWPLRKRQWRKF